ncbi:hypothetical protein [Mycolicibacterium iranicum]|nr:hypothetical protein [Mycolicibacterium iranicum]
MEASIYATEVEPAAFTAPHDRLDTAAHQVTPVVGGTRATTDRG